MPLRRSLTALVVLGVLTASTACGSRLSEEERALATSGVGQGGAGVTDGTAVATDGAAADPGAVTATEDTSGAAAGGSGTGGGATATTAAGGGKAAACAPGKATSTGVTPT